MPHQHQSLVHCFPSPTYMFFPRYHLLLYQNFSWFVPLFSLLFIIWEEALISYQPFYMFLLTQTGNSVKILNRVVRVYIFSALTLIIIYIVFTCEAHSLKIIFSLLCLLNHCCLVAVSFPTLLQPQGL